MPTTRSSARKVQETSPASSQATTGSKRKADSSPSASPAAKSKQTKAPKKQKTIEETLPDTEDGKQEQPETESQDIDMKDVESAEKQDQATNATATKHAEPEKSKEAETPATNEAKSGNETTTESKSEEKPAKTSDGTSQAVSTPQVNGNEKPEQKETPHDSNNQKLEESKTAAEPSEQDSIDASKSTQPKITSLVDTEKKPEDSTTQTQSDATTKDASSSVDASIKPATSSENKSEADASQGEPDHTNHVAASANSGGDNAIEHSSQREKATPSSVLEKGIIYFFFRGRVGIDDPSQVDDIARSYVVLRPLPRGAKLSDGPLGDANNLRVLALPKKVLPRSPKDRFMVFVEKAKTSLDELKKEFLSASDYETKTAGTRHTPAATPIGEGVYALTSTGRETHLAYVLTIPKELSEVQKDIGLEAKGSWVTSVKNPQYPGPAQAQLPKMAEFPQEILDEFRSLRWGQLQPKHLDYENCQLLVIGHKDHSFAKATETDDKEADPKEELEKLGEEDGRRVEHLEGDDTVFEDLNIDAKEYPSVQTTW